MVKKTESYKPFYPTTVGTKSHDITLQQMPAYSIRPKPELKRKCYSPGPGAYPQDVGKNRNLIPKSIYPEDRAHKYSLGVKGKEIVKHQTPSPAVYPLEIDRNAISKYETLSIYPKDNGYKFSIGGRRERKSLIKSPGPAIYPRDADVKNINSLFPADKKNKFTIRPKQIVRNVPVSPGPAQYPCNKKEMKNKLTTIYPADTQLWPTMKAQCHIKNKRQIPAPNAYPILEETTKTKKPKPDLTQKMIRGNRSPAYSIGIKHSPKQHMLILADDHF